VWALLICSHVIKLQYLKKRLLQHLVIVYLTFDLTEWHRFEPPSKNVGATASRIFHADSRKWVSGVAEGSTKSRVLVNWTVAWLVVWLSLLCKYHKYVRKIVFSSPFTNSLTVSNISHFISTSSRHFSPSPHALT